MKAMVLCAGLGERLRPLTNFIPKPLAPAPARPMVFHALDRLAAAGAELLVVNTHHLPDAVRAAIGHEHHGMRVEYSHEPEILGPTGGLRKAIDFFGDEPFLVVNGDVYSEVDFRAIYDLHIRESAALTLAVKTGLPDSKLNAIGFGDDSRVWQIWQTPEWHGIPLRRGINAGVFVYSPQIIRKFVPDKSWYGFREDFIPALFAADEKIMAFDYAGVWCDIGDEQSYLGFVRDVLAGNIPGIKPPECLKIDGVVIDPPCWISPDATVEPGARVGPNTVICAGAAVRAGAVVSGSVLVPGAQAPASAVIRDTVVVPS